MIFPSEVLTLGWLHLSVTLVRPKRNGDGHGDRE
jgi:hypothetical protein